jgi:hypothetical protein
MEREGLPYPVILKEAKELGYAEADESLDVEGCERDVLRGLDFARWTPDYILLELWNNNSAVKEFLAAKGYSIVADISPWSHFTPHRDVVFRSAAALEAQAEDPTFTTDHWPVY